ncbi:hypothetical protein [Sorangium sp. So ce1389]|uniref:hypothetical protein n=1 Tax=Sorangium sp. So ce1389 TaxID=3133336 RepID=UPI003F613106
MRVRLILENGGHALTKLADLTEAPVVGAMVEADREREVNAVEEDPESAELRVHLKEDAEDVAVRILPQAHVAYIELMKREGWEVEAEDELMAWLRHRVRRQRHVGPIAQN